MLVPVVFVMPLESADRRARRRAVSTGRRVLVVSTVFDVDQLAVHRADRVADKQEMGRTGQLASCQHCGQGHHGGGHSPLCKWTAKSHDVALSLDSDRWQVVSGMCREWWGCRPTTVVPAANLAATTWTWTSMAPLFT